MLVGQVIQVMIRSRNYNLSTGIWVTSTGQMIPANDPEINFLMLKTFWDGSFSQLTQAMFHLNNCDQYRVRVVCQDSLSSTEDVLRCFSRIYQGRWFVLSSMWLRSSDKGSVGSHQDIPTQSCGQDQAQKRYQWNQEESKVDVELNHQGCLERSRKKWGIELSPTFERMQRNRRSEDGHRGWVGVCNILLFFEFSLSFGLGWEIILILSFSGFQRYLLLLDFARF